MHKMYCNVTQWNGMECNEMQSNVMHVCNVMYCSCNVIWCDVCMAGAIDSYGDIARGIA